MNTEEKFFTPDIEDIRVGYECEYLFEGELGIWTNGFGIGSLGFPQLWEIKENPKIIRVPYLTKEQIEAEGWKYIVKTQDIWFEKEGSFDMGSWTAYKLKLQYGLHDKRLRVFAVDIDKQEYDMFRGECKDINTFRYICKLLGIKS